MREEEKENGDDIFFFLKLETIPVDKCILNILPIRSNMYTFYM